MDTQAMSAGGGTTSDLQAQRDAIPPMQVNKMNLLSDAFKVELKELINEVLDEREQFRNTTVTFPTESDYSFDHLTNHDAGSLDFSINTVSDDIITFS